MSREKIASKMVKYLEERINCENVIKFADQTKENKMVAEKLIVDNTPIAFKIINYNDDENYIKKNKSDSNDRLWLQNMFNTFDFMTEANYTGFEYFPYLYGVLNCHNDENSKVYLFYEFFDGNLVELINQIGHPSEWYDIVFQMIMINYYIQSMNGYQYNNGILQNHLYKKLSKPYYKEYQIENHIFNINHKYLIALWDFVFIVKTPENKNEIITNIDYLLNFLTENKDKIKIPPSGRIIKLLHDIKNNPNNTIDVLFQYYGPSDKQSDKSSSDKPENSNQ